MILALLAQAAASGTTSQEAEDIARVFSEPFVQTVLRTWLEGGWVMIPLLLASIYLYYEGATTIAFLGRTGVTKVSKSVWENWVREPQQGGGFIGESIRYVMGGRNRHEILDRLEAVRIEIIPKANLKIMILNVLVAVAPLMGLLGTVIGMLTTFNGLATASGQTVDLVANGIRIALITTQTGLMIAIPGYLLIAEVVRRRNAFNTFLAQLETLALQVESRRAA